MSILPSSVAASDTNGPVTLAAAIDSAGKKALGAVLVNAAGLNVNPATAEGQAAALAAIQAPALPTNAATLAAQQSAQTTLTAIQANTAPSGLGGLQVVPAASTNGTALGSFPAGARGVRLYLPAGTSITFDIAGSQPGAAPATTFTASAATTGPNWDENLSAGQMLYITVVVGSPLFRWF